MNDRERFLAVCRFERPDYVPIFGFPGAPGMSMGAMKHTHTRLVQTGMPAHVGGCYDNWVRLDVESWYRYWGTTGPITLDFGLAQGARGIRSDTRIENGMEVIEDETGALVRQVIDNANTYSMPEYVRYSVRDRASWEFWRERATPTGAMPREEMEARCRAFDDREQPLVIEAGGAYGFLRGLLGTEGVSLMLYDDPGLIHDMIAWQVEQTRRYVLPLIERLVPEVVCLSEDLCYNHGMLLSPDHFHTFCGPQYRLVCGCARACGVPVVTVDTDGNADSFVDLAATYGVNSLHPFEVKAGNDLASLRARHPRFICFGWLEKEVVNEGNEAMIEPEIMTKVPPLLAQGGYFPNGDHGIQPPVTFANLCRFMTILHDVTGNPLGEFPRTRRGRPSHSVTAR